MATALARTPLGFGIARAALGLGESANFPAAIKTVAEWFPKRERALATGLFNAGTNVGAIVAPLTVPWIAVHMGWQWAFILTGALGLLWLAVLAAALQPAGEARTGVETRTRLHPERPSGPAGRRKSPGCS